MTCGSTYAHLLVTEDGKTPDDPWDWYAGPTDYDEWYDVAHLVGREVFKRWNWLLSIEDKLAKLDDPQVDGPYPERGQLLTLLKAFATELEALPHVLLDPSSVLELSWEPGIKKAIEVARDGTCVLEQLDAATAYYKRPPLPESRPKRSPVAAGRGWGAVVVTGALAVGGVFWWRRRARGKEAR
ncbi:hypothetical protein [Paraliomyxa miuraensis]|uniref:hypothetical protein n=1 Tax=Paraliomyxa miuraensis TaxID=376150 RepID=UPI0022506F91|nr:hypothetical protein [Paraliomyxa miuraensis]MCX4244215.1 hypothetical protein [Paraliomyxa miuraensis]